MFSYKVLPLALLISIPVIAMEGGKAVALAQAAAETPAAVQKPAPELLDTVLALEQHDAIEARKQEIEARKKAIAEKLAAETAALDAELKQTATEAEKNTEALAQVRERKAKVVAGVDQALTRLKNRLADTEKKKADELALEDVALANILKELEKDKNTITQKETSAKEAFAKKKTTLEQAYDVELQKIRGSIAVQENRLKEKGAELNTISIKINDAKADVTEEKAKEEAAPKVSGGFWSFFTWKSSTTQQ